MRQVQQYQKKPILIVPAEPGVSNKPNRVAPIEAVKPITTDKTATTDPEKPVTADPEASDKPEKPSTTEPAESDKPEQKSEAKEKNKKKGTGKSGQLTVAHGSKKQKTNKVVVHTADSSVLEIYSEAGLLSFIEILLTKKHLLKKN